MIESRAKSIESLLEKIQRPGKDYSRNLTSIPDLAGVRIIVYYQDDVERVKNIVEQEFNVVERETTHQADSYSPDQFGYISIHLIIELKKSRSKLPEWQEYAGLRAEVQIRTVLQHSWAVVSHALQYKRESDVPFDLRRKLFRLAGIFELADEEFVGLRDERSALQRSIRNAIETDSDKLPVDPASLQEFLKIWPKLPSIREYMMSLGFKFTFDKRTHFDSLGDITKHCERLGITTLDELRRVIDYDPKSFLKRISSKGWIVTDAFTIYLLLIRARISEFELADLVDMGWNEDIANTVLKGARADAKV
ncbi:MAG: hypothetical protein JW947_04155 [Sedimentisphaerales bacterium]|nr:hypothetical protein [Sedimentisphaerales bacterium]